MTTDAASVWVKLCFEGEQDYEIQITPMPHDVYDLKKAVIGEWPPLNSVPAALLKVFAPGSNPATDGALDANMRLKSFLNPDDTLIVVSPPPPPPQIPQLQQEVIEAINILRSKMDKLKLFNEEVTLKIDKLQLDYEEARSKIDNLERATPSATPADLGNDELYYLKRLGLISTFKDGDGDPVLTEEEITKLDCCEKESEVVAFVTPSLERIFENLAVVNSEEYEWIKVFSRDGTTKYNQKPDMFVCHRAMYKKRSASETFDKNTENHRKAEFKYGILADWVLRDCISVTLEATMQIDNAAFGQVINYGRHLSKEHPEPNDVRVVLFDRTEFWLVLFKQTVCCSVKKCAWTANGSRDLLRDFARASSKWPKVLDSVCKKLDLVVDEGNAFLGYGAFGRVFRVFRKSERNPQHALALKIVLDKANDAVNSADLAVEYSSLICAYEKVPSHVMKGEEFVRMEGGAGLLLECVGLPVKKKTDFSLLLEALALLHKNSIFHGDPRVANAVLAGGKVKWIDFRDPYNGFFNPMLAKGDMLNLVCSLLSTENLDSRVVQAVNDYGENDYSVEKMKEELKLRLTD